jgi:hypothetical protein
MKIKNFDYIHSHKFSSNDIFRNGIFETGIPIDINPPILIIIEDTYNIVSGNTNEYQLANSPNPNNPSPMATKSVVFFLPCTYDIRVSIAPYTNKINEIARSMVST